MAYVFDAPPDVGGDGGFLKEPGLYHAQVKHVNDGKNFKGESMHGFSIEIAALAGPEKDKSLNLSFPNGESHKDGGEMARKKQAAFFLATGLIRPDQLGKRCEFDINSAEGRQVCLELENGKPNEQGKIYLGLKFTNIWHVDDPAAAKCEKDKEALGYIGKELRHPPEYFAPLHAKKVAPAKSDKDFDDL